MTEQQLKLLIGFGFALVFTVLIVIGFAWLIRSMRRSIQDEARFDKGPGAESSGFALAAYHGVIQRMKEQEAELVRLRQAERERARTSATMSEAVLSNLASGVLLFSPAGLVQQANPAARAILGYASPVGLHAREVFRGVTDLRHESGATAPGPGPLLEAVEAGLHQGAAFRRLEAGYRTPAGEERVLGITISPVRGAGGESLGATCLISDLTEISRLAQQVRLQDKMSALGEMSAGIAHEFKNSLATISGYAQMLEKEAPGGPAQEFAARITAETATLARVVGEFLSFARPQAVRAEPIVLRLMLEECARECRVELRQEGIPPGFLIHGDPTALRQVFSNLLRNSAEAARSSAPAVVEVEAAEAEAGGQRGARIVVRDNGRGITGDELSKVFLPFFTTKPQGTGLGLALVHRLVSEHGGSIAASAEGGGAAFTLWLPGAKQAEKTGESR